MPVTTEGFRAAVKTAIVAQLKTGTAVELTLPRHRNGSIQYQMAAFIGAGSTGSAEVVRQINDADRFNKVADAANQLISVLKEIETDGYPAGRQDNPSTSTIYLRVFPKAASLRHG
jgi:hypothetical protein